MNDYKQQTQSKLANLPIFNGVNGGDIKLNPLEWRNGFEKGAFSVTRLAILAGIGLGVWYVLLPILATMFAAFLAVLYPVVICFLLLVTYMARKPIYGIAKWIARKLQETFIRWDPFNTFKEQREILVKQDQEAIQKGTIIATTETNMKEQSKMYEAKANKYQQRLVEIKSEMESLNQEKLKYTTESSKEEDRYSDIILELSDLNSEANRILGAYEQAKTFVKQFGTIANTMTKFKQKYKFYLSFSKNKILNFDATVEQLKAEYEASNAIKTGTDAIKNIGLFDTKWEVMFASEVVVGAVANNIAMSKDNMQQINETMGLLNSDMTSDKALEKLTLLMGNIEAGTEIIPSAKRYNNPELKLTSEEKSSTNGIADIFNS